MKSFDTTIQELIKCYHCGNETLMIQVGEYKWSSDEEDDSNFSCYNKYKLFACPVCHNVTLIKIYGDEEMEEPNRYGQMEYYSEQTFLYPQSTFHSNSLPLKVKESFDAALKVQNIDKFVCLMALRRTLEIIVKDKGATKWGLADKIEELVQKGLLPDTLKEASSLTKILGDSAAHDKEIDISNQDVLSTVAFVKYIIEYLYIVPEKLEQYKKRFEL